jgi:MFS family permease
MGAGSLLMAVLPTYASVGLLAPGLLVLARLLQGLSIGGEFAASTTFLVESAPPGRRGLFSSFQYVSTTAGQLVASALAAVLASTLAEPEMTAWGWRVPFAVGAVTRARRVLDPAQRGGDPPGARRARRRAPAGAVRGAAPVPAGVEGVARRPRQLRCRVSRPGR